MDKKELLDKILTNLIENKVSLPVAKSQLLKIFGESDNSFTPNQLSKISKMLNSISKESFEAGKDNLDLDWKIWRSERNKILQSKTEIYDNCEIAIECGCNKNNCIPDCLFKKLYR